MKNLFIILILSAMVLSCSSDNDEQPEMEIAAELAETIPELTGKWKLIETKNDPGDGSGVYKSIVSEKTIEFSAEGTFTINGPLCELSTLTGEIFSGKVTSSSQNFPHNILISNEPCDLDNLLGNEYGFMIENSNLIIYWSACIEGCSQKYHKIIVE